MSTNCDSPGSNNAPGDLLYRQGLELHRNGRLEEAERCYRQSLALQPDSVDALYQCGLLLMSLHRNSEALEMLERAVRLRPDIAEIWTTRGNALRHVRRHEDALVSHDRALALQPDFPFALRSRGDLLLEQLNRVEDALADYDKALELAPDYVHAWCGRGNALGEIGRFPEAIATYDKALELKPGMVGALKGRGHAYFQSARIEEGMAAYTESANRLYGDCARIGAQTPFQLRHDQEQQEYRLSAQQRPSQKPGARLAGPAIWSGNRGTNPDEEWRTKKPQIVVIDNLLTPEALTQLRRFCLEEPVWRAAHPNGYLGAFPVHGFACPLLAQIAEELRDSFPAILGQHALNYFWGFKYDSQPGGIDIHADQAAVNVNFWITPDEANLDPQSGGLVVWDVAAPLNWDLESYNTKSDNQVRAIRDFLAESGAKPTRVPYRENRAVIFDSDLFHETDKMRFKDCYRDRRINITLLYGWRHHAQPGAR